VTPARREAIAAGLWRVRLHQTRIRCLAVASESLAPGGLNGWEQQPACQQQDGRIYCQRGRDALLAVASIDQMTHNYPPATPRRAMAA
jgi:hypothetical protein